MSSTKSSTFSHTYHGVAFDFARPTPEMIDLRDIARSLFGIRRFNGHLRDDWMVGHHSMLVVVLLGVSAPEYRPEGALHDGSEAYTGDPPGPFKRMLGESFKAIERPIEGAIASRFDLHYPWPAPVKEADLLAQDIEAALMHPMGAEIVRPGFVPSPVHRAVVDRLRRCGPGDFVAMTERLLAERARLGCAPAPAPAA